MLFGRDKNDELNQAISLYLGKGVSPYPKEDSAPVLNKFGKKRGQELVIEIEFLLGELKNIEPDWPKHSLGSGTEWAIAKLREGHPQINSKGAAALDWVYSWWWK